MTANATDEQLAHVLKELKSTRQKLHSIEQSQCERIAVTGLACRFPGEARTPEAFWNMLQNGESAVGEIPSERWDSTLFYDTDPAVNGKMYTNRGCFLNEATEFDAQFFGIAPSEAVRMDPQQRLLLEVTWEAIENAGYTAKELAGTNTGVFVGAWRSEYTHRQIDAEGYAAASDPNFLLGSSCSVAAGRLSYFLNLQGPNIAVDTACSASLVAIHLACQSLRNGECDLAIVGGVHIVAAPETGINLCKMSMLSPDGLCKTFDARADGYVIGEGCGIVILKREGQALADKDTVLACIHGSAINDDGRSNGMQAPNGMAQRKVVEEALRRSSIAPHLVSYVEAHGTGTALGDPIEVDALQSVLGEGRDSETPLYIGSVKTNIGHLMPGSGIAGFIKCVLALQHRAIPANLNFEYPNPDIDWDKVQVPTELIPWKPVAGRYIAGVSSFGWSGTNAHVIVESAEIIPSITSTASPQLITLSARSPEAVITAAKNLANHLQNTSEIDLANVAYTLQTARDTFAWRCALVSNDRQSAIDALSDEDAVRRTLFDAHDRSTATVMLFPGLGDHHVGMCAQLYASEPYFRQIVDVCCEQFAAYLNVDLRKLIFSDAQPVADNSLRSLLNGWAYDEPNALSRTLFAQPAVFVIEYALAQLWISRGLEPKAVIGYSLGEYVAACVAGLFSLEDAIRLVAGRAQLIEGLPVGAMLAAAVSAETLQPFLTKNLDLAGINGPMMSIAAGTPVAIADLQQRLQAAEHICRPLPTTHGFHSFMMKPIQSALSDLVSSVECHEPHIPIVSNVTGSWLTYEQAKNPDYWAQHLRQPVRFADGLETLWHLPDVAMLEVGIGQMMGSLALQHPARNVVKQPLVVSSLPSAQGRRSDQENLLRAVGQLWSAGVAIDFSSLHQEDRQRVRLPNYPFEHQRYWIDINYADLGKKQAAKLDFAKMADKRKRPLDEWFYIPSWKRSPLLPQLGTTGVESWLIFVDELGIGRKLATKLAERGAHVTKVVAGSGPFERIDQDTYSLDPSNREQYGSLINHLRVNDDTPQHIVHLWSVSEQAQANLSQQSADTDQERGFYSLLFLAQAIGSQSNKTPLHISIASNNMQSVIGGEATRPAQATLHGIAKVLPQEAENISCALIDFALPAATTQVAEQLFAEVSANLNDDVIAYRGPSRWVRSFEQVQLHQPTLPITKTQGVYLVTGGFGGLGMAVAEMLAKTVQARLVLVGRKPLPARKSWAALCSAENVNGQAATVDRINQILHLEALGADVLACTADVANVEEMADVLQEAETRFGALDGVFHIAGVPGEGLLQIKTVDDVAAVFRPKLQGTLVLYELLQDKPLDFMVLYSSIGSIMGGLGEVDYSACNAFLDAFAHFNRYQHGIPTVSINWSLWQWDAWQSSMTELLPGLYERIHTTRQNFGISFEEGNRAWQRSLASGQPQVVVSPLDFASTLDGQYGISLYDAIEEAESISPQQKFPRPNLRNPFVPARNEQEQQIADIWSDALGLERVGIHDQFLELGGNSLLGLMIISRLKKTFDLPLAATALYEGPTVGALYSLVMAEQNDEQPVAAVAANVARGAKRKQMRRRRR